MSELDYFRELNQTEEQQRFLSYISQSRGYKNNDVLNAYRAIFIKDHVEMQKLLGGTSLANKLYTRDGRTFIPGRLLIPGFSPLGALVTYVCYDALARYEAKEKDLYGNPYYFYPEESQQFKKSNFILMPYESWEVALTTGKIGLADGVFDAGAVSVNLMPCGAVLGTTLGDGVKRILKVFDEIIDFKDNDQAGTQLFLELTKKFKKVTLVKIPAGYKDIDGYLSEEGVADILNSIQKYGKPILDTKVVKTPK